MKLVKNLCFLSILCISAQAMEQPNDNVNAHLIEAAAGVNSELAYQLIDAGILINLIEAAKTGNLELIQQCLNAGADVNHQFEAGKTALMHAALYGHLACLQHLIQAGANVNQQDDTGYTALIYAASNTHLNCIQQLIQAKANINHQTKHGWTALKWAGFFNAQSSCQYLLLDRMMQFPSNTQKQKMYCFLWCMKQYGLDHNMRRYIKPFLFAAIEEENYENPEQSFAWQEIHQTIDFNRQQPLLDYLKQKQPKENNAAWCAIL